MALSNNNDDDDVLTVSSSRFAALRARANGKTVGHSSVDSPSPKKKINRLPLKKLSVPEEYERRLKLQGDGEAAIRARELMDEDLDEVKTLRHRLNLMKIQGVRQRQVEYNKALQKRDELYNQYWDNEMKKQQDEEIQHDIHNLRVTREHQKQYAQDLRDQVKESQKRKILAEERVAQEGVCLILLSSSLSLSLSLLLLHV